MGIANGTTAQDRREFISRISAEAKASGRAIAILNDLAGVPTKYNDGRHNAPCPFCGHGTKDSCRIIDLAAGAFFCPACFSKKNGDCTAAVAKSKGISQYKAARLVAGYLGHRGSTEASGQPSSPPPSRPPATSRATSDATPLADADTLDRAYRKLLENLSLSDGHREDLIARGLSTEAIDRRGYKSWTPDCGWQLARLAAAYEVGNVAARTIPGLARQPYRKQGLLIPVRDQQGRIVALKVRVKDAAAGGGKYRYMSNGNPSPGNPVHIPVGVKAPAACVRTAEGTLKADIAFEISGLPTIGFPSSNTWETVLPALNELKAEIVVVAFDADAMTNAAVAAQQLECIQRLIAEGFAVKLETWPAEDGKGIDDLLAAGKSPTVHVGDEAIAKAQEIVEAAAAFEAAKKKANAGALFERIDATIAEHGPGGIYRDRSLLETFAQLAVNDAPEFARVRDKLRSSKVKMQDFDRAIKQMVAKAVADQPPSFSRGGTGGFFESEGCICRTKFTAFQPVTVPLANFTAEIVDETTRDDGQERRVVLGVAGELANGKKLPRVEISAESFSEIKSVVHHWGSEAIIWPGESRALPAAIQALSPKVTRRTVYTHTGWRKVGDAWVFLHLNGGIGSDESLSVDLPRSLRGYDLPAVPAGDELAAAIRASLRTLDVAPGRDALTVPLLAAVYRAAIGGPDFGLHLAGSTGVQKSELAALAQQHYGSAFLRLHLPGNWSSTANSLEELAFAAKDTLFTIDDFVPQGSISDKARLNQTAERIFRGQGNHGGRLRMRADGSVKPPHPPRCLVLSTGEDVPSGESLRARMLILDVRRGDVGLDRLTQCQHEAAAGMYAQSLAAFIAWLAPRLDLVREKLPEQVAEWRNKAVVKGQHARTPSIVAELFVGLAYFLTFAETTGALTGAERSALKERAWSALLRAGQIQSAQQQAFEPAQQFVRLILSAIASGRAHLAGPDGSEPSTEDSPQSWGWQHIQVSAGQYLRDEWRPSGHRIGWIENGNVYLEPDAAYATAQRLANDQGETLSVSAATLRKRLNERGFLNSTDENRGSLLIRQTLDGSRRYVLHLSAEKIVPRDGEEKSPIGQLSGASKNTDLPTETGGFPDKNSSLGKLGNSSTDPWQIPEKERVASMNGHHGETLVFGN